MYFRLDQNRFFMPVSLLVPGSQIPFVKGGDKDKATLDILGEVIDEVKRPIGRARETVKLNLDPRLKRGRKILNTPPASNCRQANTTSNLWFAKTRPAAWVRLKPISRCPI